MIRLSTEKKSTGKNKKVFRILHHTGGGTFLSNCNTLSGPKSPDGKNVSAHFIVGPKGNVAAVENTDAILWHIGEGMLDGKIINMNDQCIGIEIVSDGETFTREQYDSVVSLCAYTCIYDGIGVDMTRRHADFSEYRGKWDVGMNFFMNNGFAGFQKDVQKKVNDFYKLEREKKRITDKYFAFWDGLS